MARRLSQKSSSNAIKKLLAKIPKDHELESAIWALEKYDDTATALVGCTNVEHALRLAILSKMRRFDDDSEQQQFENELFSDGQNGPLATVSAKARIAYAMGIIGPETKADINTLRHIRNGFAHVSPPISFSSLEIAQACNGLYFMKDETGTIAPRLKYIVTCTFFTCNLLTRAQQNLGTGIGSMMIALGPLP